MAKKKELPKAMMGKIIKPVVRAMITGTKAAKKGYQEAVAASKVAKAEKAANATKKTKSDWLDSNTNKNTTPNKKDASKKSSITTADTSKVKIGKIVKGAAIAAGTGATLYGLANRKRRTAKD